MDTVPQPTFVVTRAEIAQTDKWHVESLYPNEEAWNAALALFAPQPQHTPCWPELACYKGTLGQGPAQILGALETLMKIERELSKLITYAHLRHDEEIGHTEHKTAYEKISFLAHRFAQESAWFQPEILSLTEEQIQACLSSPLLAAYRFLLEKIVRLRPYTLPANEEKLLALASQPLDTPHKAFSAISDADFVFDTIKDSAGCDRPLSHALYSLYIRDQDRQLRENAFKSYHQKYSQYANTLCELLNGQIQNHLFNAKSRGYSSCLEAALFSKNIPVSTYFALIDAVHQGIGSLHRYMKLRKHVLQLEELHLYDLYVPLTDQVDIRMSYDEAAALVVEATTPLGGEYQNFLRSGLLEEGWVDRYENKQKRSGAYSSGCYDSKPYILMNYKGLLRDVFTLAHEAGHSMHSLYSRRSQPYQYSDYPIFLAEVASIFNEKLLARTLLKKLNHKAEKIFLLHQMLEDIRGTLFRQTMFAEFELQLHQHAEAGTPLTPSLLKEEYLALNRKYFGPDVLIDQEIEMEWARIPHFYYNFYVFQYATGMSAALALENRISSGDTHARDAYLHLLKGGSSAYPIPMLRAAGVDMESSAAILDTMRTFESLLTELETLMVN